MANKEKAVDKPQQASPWVVNLPQPPVRNAEEYLKAYIGYIYTAVGAISQEVASIDLHLYKATFNRVGEPKIQEIYEHPALSVLNYVNDIATLYDTLEATQTYLELTGEAYWVVLKDGKNPKEFWLLRPDWVKVIPSATDVIDHYKYYAGGVLTEGVVIPKENVVPFKYFNPLNPYRGKGTTQAAALPFDILNFAQEYNRNFFFNSAIPSMVFSTDQKISEQAVKRFLNQWQSQFGGRSKSNKVAFLGSGLKLDKASFGAKELDFNEQMKTMRDDVLAVFKVPKTVLGLTDDVNRANADATTRAFMERVITPRMKRLVDMLNEFYLPMFIQDDNSYFFDFTDPSPEDVELKLKRYESGRKYTWLTPNEIRAEENLEPLPGGDDLFAPLGSGSSPLAGLPSGNDSEDTTEEPTDDDSQNESDTVTPNDDSNNDEDTTKPTSDIEESRGFRAMIARMLGFKVVDKSNIAYKPPAYLKNIRAKKKHMVRLPVKTPKQLEKETLQAEFVGPLKKFIAELISQDDYSDLQKKKSKKEENRLEDLFSQALDKARKETAKGEVQREEPESTEDEQKTSGYSDEQKDAHWNKFIEKANKDEKTIKETAQSVFSKQEKMVLDNLEEQGKGWKQQRLGLKATPAGVIPSLAQLGKLWKVLELVLEEIYKARGQETLDELNIDQDFEITTEFAVAYLDEYSGALIKAIDTVTREKLQATLSEGYDKGESIPKLKKRVQEVFTEASSSRAEAIARTESIKASNAASVEGYRQSGVVQSKEWLTERDSRACPWCLELDGKTIGLNKMFFKKGEEFTVDGETLKFELSDVGEPPAHTNCRCTTIPVLKEN
jgi:HK97 family phage portal protein